MAVVLTPAILEAAYVLLRNTSPFRGWRLPPPENIKFQVLHRTTTNGMHGDYIYDGRHHIRIAGKMHHTIGALLLTIAHEMCHMKQCVDGNEINHGALFAKLADRVCKVHVFDRGQF